MTAEKAIVLIECSANELRETLKETTMPSSAAEQLQRYIDAYEMAISALRQQDVTDTCIGKNEPLTLDELRKMDGEPVFLVDLVHKSDPKVPDLWGGWIVFTKHDQNGFIPRGGGFFSNDGYGKTWLAYRQKQEEG